MFAHRGRDQLTWNELMTELYRPSAGEHPITPPPELVHQWVDMLSSRSDQAVFTMAAQWGADMELEACCLWMERNYNYPRAGHPLRLARRPKPPTNLATKAPTTPSAAHWRPSMTDQHPITPPPLDLLKKFSAQAQAEANSFALTTGYLKTVATLCIEWFVNSQSTSNDRQIRSSEIEPPPELVEQWLSEHYGAEPVAPGAATSHVATEAARWGWDQRGAVNEDELQKARDEELEASCEWLSFYSADSDARDLRIARRPKPPSPKNAALEALAEERGDMKFTNYQVICSALESIPND